MNKSFHSTYDIIALGTEDDDPDKESRYVIKVERDDGEMYKFPPTAPLFHNVYCGTDKEFE